MVGTAAFILYGSLVCVLAGAARAGSEPCDPDQLAMAVARVLSDCGCPGPDASRPDRKRFAACRGALLRALVGQGSLSASCEDPLYDQTQHCIGDDGGSPDRPVCGGAVEDAAAVADTLARITELCDCTDAEKLYRVCREQVIAAAQAGSFPPAPPLSDACAEALEVQEPPCLHRDADIPPPGSSCDDAASCEGQLASVLPPATGIASGARKTARKLLRLDRKVLRALERGAAATGGRQQRQYDKARDLLDKLLDVARAADDRGRLGMPLGLIEAACGNLLAVLADPS
jgi:hypothetical protein